jgi:hypothetical protein
MPAMLAMGMTRVLARPALRARLALVAGVVVVVFGVVSLARGLVPGMEHLHHWQ